MSVHAPITRSGRASRASRALRAYRRIALAAAASAAVTLVLGACGGSDATGPGRLPHTDVPAELQGRWIHGAPAVANLDGHIWENGFGTGLMYRFLPDGQMEYAWMESTSSYGCEISVEVYKQGAVEVDEEQHTITAHFSRATMHATDSCHRDGNYEKQVSKEGETLVWDWTQDQFGHVYLLLRHPDGGFSDFYQAD